MPLQAPRITSIFVFIFLSVFSAQAAMNFDYDGKADFSVYRSSERTWYNFSSEAQTFTAVFPDQSVQLIPRAGAVAVNSGATE